MMNSSKGPATIQAGLNYYQAGQYSDALKIFDQILKIDSVNGDALHLGGLSLMKLNRLDQSEEYIRKAVRQHPRIANFQNSLGMVYKLSRQYERAAKVFNKTLQLEPNSLNAHFNLSEIHKESGDLEKAIELLESALKLDPAFPDTRYQLANILKEAGRIPESISYYLSLLIYFPEVVSLIEEGKQFVISEVPVEPRNLHVQALNNLCVLLIEEKREEEAIQLLQMGIRYVPEHISFHLNLGMANSNLNRWDSALNCFETALELQPENANALFNIGQVCKNLGKYNEAIAFYQKAINANTLYFEAYNNIGLILLEAKRYEEARNFLEKALEICPDHDGILINMACLSIDQGLLDEAKKYYQNLANKHPENSFFKLRLMTFCPDLIHTNEEIDFYREQLQTKLDQLDIDKFECELENLTINTSSPHYNLQFHGRNDRVIKEKYAEINRSIIQKNSSLKEFDFDRSTGKSRVGYFMTAGHEGAFERFIGGVIKRLDFDKCDHIIFCGSAHLDKLRNKIACTQIQYVPVPIRLDHAVQTIRSCQLDLLYHWEVGSDSMNYLLPFFKTAKKQLVSMGLPITTGIKEIDYFLTSDLVEPEGCEAHYTEKLLKGKTLLSWQERRVWNHQESILEELGICSTNHLYFCGHKIQKFHPDFDEVLAQILDTDSNGLILVPGDVTGQYSPLLYERMKNQYPELIDRIHILPKLDYNQYFSLLDKSDVLLDPLHYGGGLSSYDGFSANKVIVTLPGEFHRGRYTGAFYERMGLTHLVNSSIDEYVQMSVKLGTDREYRKEIERQIEAASDMLFENQEVVEEYQQIFEKLIHE